MALWSASATVITTFMTQQLIGVATIYSTSGESITGARVQIIASSSSTSTTGCLCASEFAKADHCIKRILSINATHTYIPDLFVRTSMILGCSIALRCEAATHAVPDGVHLRVHVGGRALRPHLPDRRVHLFGGSMTREGAKPDEERKER